MKTQTVEINGKTIFGYQINGSKMLLSFTDNTFAVIQGSCYYDSDVNLDFDEFYWEQWDCLVDLNICSQNELDALQAEQNKYIEDKTKKYKLAEYARLKAELGL